MEKRYKLNEQYGEGIIPLNTKTVGGPILLTSSFTYVRDWINRHQFKNESDARLIGNLYTGAPITAQTIWQMLMKLRQHIKQLVENDLITDKQQKLKLEHLLRTKKWNPYCFRHSAITDDSDHLPEFALTKKVRWVIGSRQPARYIKNRMGDELKSKILERAGIKIENNQHQIVSRTCGRCNYVNKLESKYCERVGCAYPQTQLALDEIKAAKQVKFQTLRNEILQVKDQEIQELRKQLADVIEQQQGFDMKFHKLLDIVDQMSVIVHDEGGGVVSFIGEEIVKLMPRPATKEQRLQKMREFQEERRKKADAKYLYDD